MLLLIALIVSSCSMVATSATTVTSYMDITLSNHIKLTLDGYSQTRLHASYPFRIVLYLYLRRMPPRAWIVVMNSLPIFCLLCSSTTPCGSLFVYLIVFTLCILFI